MDITAYRLTDRIIAYCLWAMRDEPTTPICNHWLARALKARRNGGTR